MDFQAKHQIENIQNSKKKKKKKFTTLKTLKNTPKRQNLELAGKKQQQHIETSKR
jgi:hypothetical protein